jgi:serine/threonine protein kinase/Flp pilus assembly protein TadD
MDPERWNRRKAIFAAAAELPADQRTAFLRAECEDDRALLLEIQQLIAGLSNGGDSLANVLPLDNSSQPPTIQPGSVLDSRFRIIRLIGKGGMGEVYEADDLELTGRVALKTLRPELSHDPQFLQRFKREVNLARQITHPNVCRVFDVGSDDGRAFLTMELLSGESLSQKLNRGPLSIEEVQSYADQILQGLAAAHAKRITHRDLKPGNITITSDDIVKLVDFGLAKLIAPPAADLEPEAETLVMTQQTAIGVVLGTVGYMSPEQALGRPVDERADLFSFGAVLYEMITRRKPFGTGPAGEVIARLVTEQPEPARNFRPELTQTMEEILNRCLEKDKSKRYASAREALAALRGVSAIHTPVSQPAITLAPRVDRRRWIYAAAGGTALAAAAGFGIWRSLPHGAWDSIAVLPLINEGPPENEYLTDGFTESLINEISSGELRVIARNAVYRLAKPFDAIEVARKLGVSAVLTGRLMHRSNNILTVSLELISVATNEHLWGKRMDIASSALQTLQSQLASEVLAALRVPRRGGGIALQPRIVDPAAYELYLKGRHQWNKRTLDAFEKAIDAYKQSVDLVPSYALPHAGLADVYAFQSGIKPPNDIFPRAIAEARRALELDSRLPEAHAALAFSLLHYEWDWAGSESECRKAIELNPNYPSAHSYYGRLLTVVGRFTEAIQQVRLAQTLDPLSPALGQSMGLTLYLARRHSEAAAHLEKLISAEKNFTLGYFTLAVVRMAQGNAAAAVDLLEHGFKTSPNDSGAIAEWGMANGLNRNAAKANEAIAKLEQMSTKRYIAPYYLSLPYIGLGDKQKALDWLEKAVEDHSWPLPYIKVEPKMDILRSEPRFEKIIQRLKLA